MPASVEKAPVPSEKGSPVVPRKTDIENPPEKPVAPEQSEQVKKRQSFLTRTLWTFIMIGGFICECSHLCASYYVA